MAALFGGNPLSTPVGQMIERATDGTQASENWGLFMEVCDLINETDEGPKDAIKALRKRLTQNAGKNNTAILYSLTCLETCVKNCGRRFHIQLANKDFLHEMVKVIGPKYDPPQAVQEKVLSLIQTWADAFRGQPDLKEVEKVYQELKSRGIEFPMTDLDHMAPIHTPARSHPDSGDAGLNRQRPANSTRAPSQMQAPRQAPVPVQAAPSGPVNPSMEQMAKLKSELDVVQGNIRVMAEMLNELSPSTVDPSDLELLQELNRTNRQMQQRLVELLDKIANEEITNELLRINDDINNVFLRYERFERYRTGQSGQNSSASLPQVSPEPSPQDSQYPPSYDQVSASSAPVNVAEGNLIDLGLEDSGAQSNQSDLNSKFSNMGLGAGSGSSKHTAPATDQRGSGDDFDMFAHSRQSFDQNKKSHGEYSTNQEDQYKGSLSDAVNAKSSPAGYGQTVEDVLKGLAYIPRTTEAMHTTPSENDVLKLQERESEYDEMEQWLTAEQKLDLEKTKSGNQQEPVSSSEFDQFLAERSAAADSVPSIAAATGQQQRQSNRNRQLKKDEEDNPLFAL